MGDNLQSPEKRAFTGFRENNETVLRSVYLAVFPKVRNHVIKNSGNEDQAKDIFQEAFIICWKNIKAGKLTGDKNVEGYLFTISKNKWTDYLRSSVYKKTVVESGAIQLQTQNDESLDEVREEKNRSALQKAIRLLGEGCKDLLTQFYFERKSMDLIAKELQLGSASVRNKKYRCMEKLRSLALEIKNNG